MIYQNDSHPPSWIFENCFCFMHVWTIYNEHLVAFITAKFGWNQCSSFNNMQVLIFSEFGLKIPIHAPNGSFDGILTSRWAAVTS